MSATFNERADCENFSSCFTTFSTILLFEIPNSRHSFKYEEHKPPEACSTFTPRRSRLAGGTACPSSLTLFYCFFYLFSDVGKKL